MEIVIRLDDELARASYSRGVPVLLEIYLDVGGRAYPSRGWTDFGAVVLVWWLDSARRLLQGSSWEEFLFMDGPHGLTAMRDGPYVVLRSREGPTFAEVELAELTSALLNAAEIAAGLLATVPGGAGDSDTIRQHAFNLRGAYPQ